MKVGLVLPMVGGTETLSLPRYAELRELALQAEDAGFDALCLPDHLMLGGTWECWSVLAALAARRAVRAWLEPWLMLQRYGQPRPPIAPPPALHARVAWVRSGQPR